MMKIDKQTILDAPPTGLIGGISSSFRINPFTGVALKIARAHGSTLETTDGRRFIDMFMAHGSSIVGHGNEHVTRAVAESLDVGVLCGYETGLGEIVADQLVKYIPSAEAVRFSPSGSEAVSTALRIARAYTQRDIVVRIDGQFHGSSDYMGYNQLAGSVDHENPGGRPSRKIITTGGIPAVVAETIVPVPWNDLEALEVALAENSERIAAVLCTPIDFNNGCMTPDEGYLAAVKTATHRHGAVLVFDEILCGFKTGIGGAQTLYGVTPDLTTLSKALSSGMPLSAIVGSSEVMSTIQRLGTLGAIQGGTFAGNLPGLAAARATLELLTEPGFYPALLGKCETFFEELQNVFDRVGVPARVQSAGCSFGIYLGTTAPVRTPAQVDLLDAQLRRDFFTACIDEGVYFHTDFTISAAHTDADLARVLEVADRAARRVAA